jgi:hypothetical protein
MVLGYFGFGRIIYVSLLFTNAIAILNEERFLAKSVYHSLALNNAPQADLVLSPSLHYHFPIT